jgi:methionyl-tRNA formyltransferase
MNSPLRIIFMGTPPFAVAALDALHEAGHSIVAAYTRAPKPAGRGKALMPSAVHARAEALGVPVSTPRTLRDANEQAKLAALDADVAVVAAYGLILPAAVLAAPRLGCINIHASLLPRWRGAAPIQRAILAGDATTGITIMQMDEGLDTGAMIRSEATPIDGKTAGDLFAELAQIGGRLIVETLAGGPIVATPQPAQGVTHAAKIDKAESRLDPALPAAQLERQVRAFNPAPGAWVSILGDRVKILAARVEPAAAAPGVLLDDALLIGTGADALRPLIVQRAGKPAMPVQALLNGWRVPAGTRID